MSRFIKSCLSRLLYVYPCALLCYGIIHLLYVDPSLRLVDVPQMGTGLCHIPPALATSFRVDWARYSSSEIWTPSESRHLLLGSRFAYQLPPQENLLHACCLGLVTCGPGSIVSV